MNITSRIKPTPSLEVRADFQPTADEMIEELYLLFASGIISEERLNNLIKYIYEKENRIF